MTIIRPGQRVVQLPGIGISTSRRAVSAGGAAGWWVVAGKTCVAAYQPKGAASYAASKINVHNPGTYDVAEGVAPSWSSGTGWTFAGAEYLSTGIVPEAEWSVLLRFANQTGDGVLVGCRDWNNGAQYYIEIASWGGRSFNGSTTTLWDAAFSSGVKALAGRTAYTNGSAVGTSPDTDAAPNYELYLGARKHASTQDLYVGADILAVSVYSDTLSSGEVATVSAAMAAL